MKINHIVLGNSISFVICLTTAAHDHATDPCWKEKWTHSFCQRPCITWETWYKETHFTVSLRGMQSWRAPQHRQCEDTNCMSGCGNKSLYIESWQLPFEEHKPRWHTTPNKWMQHWSQGLILDKSTFVPYKTYAFRVVMEMSHREYPKRPSHAQIRNPRIKSLVTKFKIPPDTAQSTAFTYLQPGCDEKGVQAVIKGKLFVRECVAISAGNKEGSINLHVQMLLLGIAMVTSTNHV